MTGSASSYNMSVNAAGFGIGTLTGQSFGGNLVGPGVGGTPITGAIGNFSFDHGSASAVGGYGTDLN